MKAVIYARYSSSNQREESVEGQIRECTEYAKHNEITLVGTYIDRAQTATTDNRREFQRMIKDSAKCLFDVIIVWKLDRFARSRHDSAVYRALLKKNGVKVISATENISEGPEGIMLEAMLESMAEYHSAELAVKVHRGMTENALKGKHNGGTTPLGYKLSEEHNLEIDPLTAPIVLEAYTRYAEGETLKVIAESFNGRGLRTSMGKPFNINSFDRVLCNRRYLGEYTYNGRTIPGVLPAIVPEELFNKVQERKAKNKRAPAKAKAHTEYLLTTKLICGDCEKLMAGESGRSRNGDTHYYYKCHNAKRGHSCKKKGLRKAWLERGVVVATVNTVLQDKEIDRIADKLVVMQERENTLLPTLRQQLYEVDKALNNLVDAIQQGLLSKTTKQRLDELETRKEELETSILQEELARPKYTKNEIVRWLTQFKNGNVDDVDYQRRIIDSLLNTARVFDNYLVLTYNYNDHTETISFADIEAALGSDLSDSAEPVAP